MNETFRSYDVTDGLQSNEFNGGAYHRNRDGELFFGGINGVNVFRPAEVRDNPFVPPVVLTSFKKYNEEVALGTDPASLSEVILGPDEKVVSFSFAALSFAAPEENRYAYKLEGFRDEWIELGSKRDITFTNLDPGTYTLRAKGSNDDGVWNEDGLSLDIVVEPPFWRTWWFLGLVLMTATGTLSASYQLRTRRMRLHNRALEAEVAERRRAEEARERLIGELEAKNVELETRNAEMERFTYTVSHDLKTPLVTIKGFLGLLQRDAKSGDVQTLEHDIHQISDAADTMVRLLADLLELSRIGRLMNPPETVSLVELAQEAVGLAAGRINERGVEVAIDPAMPEVVGDRLRLLEVLQNLVDNAVKFMGDQPAPHRDRRPPGRRTAAVPRPRQRHRHRPPVPRDGLRPVQPAGRRGRGHRYRAGPRSADRRGARRHDLDRIGGSRAGLDVPVHAPAGVTAGTGPAADYSSASIPVPSP